MRLLSAPLPMKMYPIPSLKVGTVKVFKGGDTLPRVRNRNTKPEAEHRVPTGAHLHRSGP
jgi:hypothetical protein